MPSRASADPARARASRPRAAAAARARGAARARASASRAALASACLAATLALGACAGRAPPIAPPPPGEDLEAGGVWKVGSPYEIAGRTYMPAEDWDYDEVGVASWYGPGFHGRRTANGETFDQNAVTAAHRTLPMPSLVEVENLENRRRLHIRVNDRGPFVGDRIIDLSRRAAALLGFERAGTARVRVRLLEEESRALKAIALGEAPASSAPRLTRVAYESRVLEPRSDPGPPVPEGEGIGEGALGAAEPLAEEALSDSDATGEGPTAARVVRVAPEEPAEPAAIDAITAPGGTEVFLDGDDPGPASPGLEEPGAARWYVQVGSFRSRANAEARASALSEFGAAGVEQAEVLGASYWRVRLGPFVERGRGEEVARGLVEEGWTDVLVIRREEETLE